MSTVQDLEVEIEKIKERNQNLENSVSSIFARNKRVEREKEWETSWTKKLMIAVLTYVVIATFFIFANFPEPLKSAIVPSIAFILSTLSIPFIKNLWLDKYYKK